MKTLFNFFKKKEPTRFKNTKDTYDSILMRYTINGKEYAIIDSQTIKIQSNADDIQVYGWALEFRFKNTRGEWNSWSTYLNNKIYNNKSSALDAAIKVNKLWRDDCEFRISPLYKMNEPQYREYKIDQLLTDNPKNSKYEVKVWKVKEDCELEKNNKTYKYKKGSLFIKMGNGIRLIRDQKTPIDYNTSSQFIDLMEKNKLEEVDIRDEKWVHPHLCKELKPKK